MDLDNGNDVRDLRYPKWQKPLQTALTEADQERLQQRVAHAEAAIFQRLQELADSADSNGERQELAEASRSLLVLKKEALKYPGW